MAPLNFRRSQALKRWAVAWLGIWAILAIGCKSPPRATIQPRPAVVYQPPVQRPVAQLPQPALQPTAQIPPAQPPAWLQAAPEARQVAAITPLPPPEALPDAEAPLLTLDEAIATGVRDNPRLRQLAAHARAARASADVAYAPFLPEFGTSFRYSGFNVPVLPGGSYVPASLQSGVTSFLIAEAGVQYTIADFGRREGHYGQAVNRARIEEMAWARAYQTIAFEVAQSYFQLLAAESNWRVREQAVRDAERILDDTKARREGGVAERESVLRAEVEFSQARQYLLGAYQAVRDALATLNVAMGRPAQTPLRVVEVTAQPGFNQSLEDCLQWAIADRREIRMAREAVAEAQRGIQAAQGELLPKIYMRGTVLRADSPGPLNGFVEGIGVHVEQPLYAGGRYKGEVRRNQEQVAAAYAGLQAILDNVSLQVNLSYQAIDTDRQRIQLGVTSVAQARENLRLVRVRYNNGNATPTDIVDAQTALTQAETTYFTAIYGYLEGLARLDYALGGDQRRLLEQLQPERVDANRP